MTGPGDFPSTTIQIAPYEAATGATKVVEVPGHGPLTVLVAPGTVDGTMLWVPSTAGPPVLVTLRVGKARRRLTTKQQVLAYVSAVVLVAGCCAGGSIFALRDTGKKPAAATAPGKSPAPDAKPLTAVEYTAALTAADSAIGADFKRLATNDKAQLATAAPQAAKTLREQSAKLLAMKPPAEAAQDHGGLVANLEGFADDVDGVVTDPPKAACPAAATSAYVSLLSSTYANLLHETDQRLAAVNPAYAFGKFLPVAPKIATTRPANGSFVKAGSRHGAGKLKIKNGAVDATISLVPTTGAKKPVFTVYVRAKASYTVSHINSGVYYLYYAAGTGWNPKLKGFVDNCDFSKFNDKFAFKFYPYYTTWEITMTATSGGNLTSSEVDPKAFPTG